MSGTVRKIGCEVLPRDTRVVMLPRNLDQLLANPATLQCLALNLAEEEVSRRQVPQWISDRIDHFEGLIVHADGTRLETYPGQVDDAFNDEPSLSWVSTLYSYIHQDPKQKPQKKVRPRLMLLLAALIIQRCYINPDRRTWINPFPPSGFWFDVVDSHFGREVATAGYICPLWEVGRAHVEWRDEFRADWERRYPQYALGKS